MGQEVWLTTIEAAGLEGISRQAALVKAQSSQWTVTIDSAPARGGNAGKRYLVALTSLSPLAQKRFYDHCQEKAAIESLSLSVAGSTAAAVDYIDELPITRDKETKEKGPVNLAEVKALVGGKRFEEMMMDAEQKARAVEDYRAARRDNPTANKGELAKIIAARYGTTSSTLYRWEDDYEMGGIAALMRKLPTQGVGTTHRSVSDDMEKLIYAEYLQAHRPPAAHVHRKLNRYCEINGIKKPCRSTVYRIIEELEETRPDLVCLAREGAEEYMKRFAAKVARKDPDFTNQVWEGDHHKMDVFINYQGRAVRPWITTWMDVATRTITGWTIAIQANGRTIGLSLRHGMLEKRLPTWDRAISKPMKKALEILGWDNEMLAELAGQVSPVKGMPDTLYIDNGEDYKAKVRKGLKHEDCADYPRAVRGFSSVLEIKTMFCTPYSPWAKGHLERWFGTLTGQLSRYLPGYCGSDNGKKRPYNLDEQAMAARGDLLDIEELYYISEIYVHLYHNTIHSSLGMTPFEKREITPLVREGMPEERTLDMAMMDLEKVKVYTTGIQKFGTMGNRRHYNHPALDKYIGRSVIIRYDPNRIGELLVFDPKTGSLICTATNKELMGWGASKDDYVETIRQRSAKRKETKETLRGLQEHTLEKTTARRKAAGPAMVTGDMRTPEKGTRYITGLEQAAKEAGKNKGPQPAGAAQAKAKTSRFDEMIIKAGRL